MLTDTHCHLYFDQFNEDRDAVLTRAGEAGVERILVPGVDLASSHAAVELAEAYPAVYAAVGVHPNSALTWEPTTFEALRELAEHPKVVAIGEIGLDYYRDRAPRSLQKRVFEMQLNLAGQVDLPVIVHTRNGSTEDRACIHDILQLLIDIRPKLCKHAPGVIHSFSGNETEALRAIENGYFIGITGPVTFQNAHTLRSVVASVPVDRLLIETDGPFLTPHPHRSKRNEPAYVRYVAEKIGQILGKTPNQIAEVTAANAQKLFRWREVD